MLSESENSSGLTYAQGVPSVSATLATKFNRETPNDQHKSGPAAQTFLRSLEDKCEAVQRY